MGNIYKILGVLLFVFLLKVPQLSYGQEQAAVRILLFGDSIVAGYRHAAHDKLDRQLESMLRQRGHLVNVINAGISGDTTGGGVNRIKSTIERYKPHITLIALGGNDLLRRVDPKIVRRNVDSMLRISRETGAYVILSAVVAPASNGVQYQRGFNAIYPELASKYSVPLYPFLIQSTYGRGDLMQSDGVHPSAKGTKLIAQELAAYFSAGLKK